MAVEPGSKAGSTVAKAVDTSAEESDQTETAAKRPSPSSDHTSHRSKRARVSARDVQLARETAELFKSNIFKLEVDEMVRELRLKPAHCKLMEKALHRLYETVLEIPKSGEMSLKDVEKHFAQCPVAVPFPDPKPASAKYSFEYDTPEDTSLVGSFGLKTGIQQPQGMAIDVALTMPSRLLQAKDYLNYRALYKRAVYLAWIAEHLGPLCEKNELPVKISYEYADGDTLCPTIRIESFAKDKKGLVFEKTGFRIRLYVGFPQGVFEPKKLLPDRNCIRIQSDTDKEDLPPTPLYNASVLTSCSYLPLLKYLYTSKKAAEAFRDACVLGKVWLAQRGFSSNIQKGGFGHFEFVTLMAALLEGGGEHGNKILLHGFSSYQLFKATIKYLATQDLCDEGYLSFCSVIGEHKSVYKSEGFAVPTIFDKNTKLNILWKMTPSSYSLLRKHAAETFELLNDVATDRFQQTFILKANTKCLQYDVLIRLPLNEGLPDFNALKKISFLTVQNYACSKIYKLLRLALGNRVHEIAVFCDHTSSMWPLIDTHPSSGSPKMINIGLFLDPEESEKRVTKGPLHSQKAEGEKFAAFWGQKAQVRRYKDGNIQYSCLWPTDSPTISIVKYILDLHLKQGVSSKLQIDVTRFNGLLPECVSAGENDSHPLVMPLHFQQLRTSFEALCKTIYNLDSLPLAVKAILPASASLRGTSLLVPVPFAVGSPDFVNECVLQFETSKRWPDEILALEKTKTAFLLKIEAALKKRSEGYGTFLTSEDSVPYLPKGTTTELEILTPEGYGFRLRVLTEHDETLYLRAIENAPAKQKHAVTSAYVEFTRKYIGCVKHHRAVAKLVTRFPFLGPTIRLFKKWLEAQMLLVHFPEQLVELLVVKVFVDPAPYAVPASMGTGFLRVLDMLSHWNWREDPLILDLTPDQDDSEFGLAGKLSVQEYQTMEIAFRTLRKEDPSGLHTQMFVGTRDDPSGKLWSSNCVGIAMASRLSALSRAVMGMLQKPLSKQSLSLLFTPSLKDYQFVIQVEDPDDQRPYNGMGTKLPQYPEDSAHYGDPLLRYFTDLQARFSNVAVLSCHRYTAINDNTRGRRNVIVGIFNPAVGGKKKFRPNVGYNVKPTETEGHVECNKDAIVGEMVALGGDFVQEFHFN